MTPRLTPARRRALEAIRDGYGRCGTSSQSGFLVFPGGPVRRDVLLFVRGMGWAERGERVPDDPYAFYLYLSDSGREILR